MATIDKVAIGWSIAIVAAGVAFAFMGSGMQEHGTSPVMAPTTQTTTPTPAPTPATTQPTKDPFADIVQKVKDKAGTAQTTTGPTKPTIQGYERLTSSQDPGQGHEGHQLAVILPPSDKVYSGTLKYDASEPIQLVTLTGPLGPGEDKGQPIWTPDGKTKFALTFVDPNNARGEWKFAGNALAVHTMKTTPFIVDYKVDYTETPVSDTVKTGTSTSVQDPGVGHESHQLAVILPPSDKVYSGILAYSASEPIQLVSLKGPLAPGETAPATWTPDGKTIFALTFVDPKTAMGTWEFSGNALAVHTMKTTPFTVSYSVSSTVSAAPHPTPAPAASAPTSADVKIPTGTSTPGCDQTKSCFDPDSVTIAKGGKVTWTNTDTAAHTVTSGSPTDGPSGVFDSSLIMSGNSFEFTFADSGTYTYFCMVHPWMTGSVTVN